MMMLIGSTRTGEALYGTNDGVMTVRLHAPLGFSARHAVSNSGSNKRILLDMEITKEVLLGT